MNNLQSLEGLLFVAGESGITKDELLDVLAWNEGQLNDNIAKLKDKYQSDSQTSFQIQEAGNTYKLVTKPELATVLDRFFDHTQKSHLSPAALEILAIVAYRQPITRIEVDNIRGVQSGTTLQNLVLRNLIEETGRLDEPGRPKTYGTTSDFLDYFGLKDLSELPDIKEKSVDEETDTDLFKQFENTLKMK